MSQWFRFYTSVVDDPKAQMLAPELFKHWVNVLCIAAQNDGELPPLAATAFTLRLPETKAAGILAKLCSLNLLDKTEKSFKPHNWDGRQYKHDKTDNTNAERQKRYRNAKRNGVTGGVTHDDSNGVTTVCAKRPDTDTDTEAEKKETRASALVDDGWPNDYREQFWKLYPHKIGKPDALAKLERIRKRGVSWVSLMDGLRRYIASKPVDRPWCNPATWLNQARWEDQPAGSVVATTVETGIDWDAVLTSFKRFGIWSKHAGPDLGSPECRAPADMLAKYGFARAPIAPPTIPHLRSMDS
jgi:hypothetical protein